MVGAQSGAWVPMMAEDQVVGVLVFASTDAKRTFPAGRARAPAGDRLGGCARARAPPLRGSALRGARAGAAGRRGGAADPRRSSSPKRCWRSRGTSCGVRCDLGSVSISVERRGARELRSASSRPESSSSSTRSSARSTPRSHTAGLLAENQRRLDQQAALLHAAQVVTSELEIEAVLERLVAGGDQAARRRRGRLLPRRRRARRPALRGRARVRRVARRLRVLAGRARRAGARRAGAVAAEDYGLIADPVPHAAYDGFARALVAPMVWAGETRGVLGVGIRDATRSFSRGRRRAARGVRVARVARAAQRRELRRAVAPGARAARLLSHRVAAR